MKNGATSYVGTYGQQWDLAELDAKERKLLADLQDFAKVCHDGAGSPVQRWCDFDNYRVPRIIALYEARGLTRKQIIRSALHRIGQDISGRLGIALGLVAKPNYRGYLAALIETQFKTRRAFCKATGISEDMLSHVLAGRKDLSVKTLSQALDRIGYTIQFVPRELAKPAKSKSA